MGRDDSNVRLAVDDRKQAQAGGKANVSKSDQLTATLEAAVAGDSDALNRLVPLIYDDLHEIAHYHLRAERPSHTLNTTAIVHEAYVRLAGISSPSWRDRAHFLAISSRVIRHILIDYERRRMAEKRGGDMVRVPLNEDLAEDDSDAGSVEFLALDAALCELARHDPRLEQVVECRFFGGLTGRETAEVLGISSRTVERDWVRARAYLRRALRPATDKAEKAEPG